MFTLNCNFNSNKQELIGNTIGKNARVNVNMNSSRFSEKKQETTLSNTIVFNRPSRNDFFVERDKENKKIATAFKNIGEEVCFLLTGMSGSGKTQIVNQYFNKNWEKYEVSAYFEAGSEENLLKAYKDFCKQNKISLDEESSVDDVVNKLTHWLSSKRGVFLVYDNVSSYSSVSQYLMKTISTHTLITTCNKNDWPFREENIYTVGHMETTQSLRLLENILGIEISKSQKNSLGKLCSRLKNLPLALSQAGNYMKNNDTSAETYIKLYNEIDSSKSLLKYKEALGNKVHQSVFVTFQLNINALEKEEKNDAISLLDTAAFCYTDKIPVWLLKKINSIGDENFERAKGDLRRYSLYDLFRKGSEYIVVHRVLARVRQIQLFEFEVEQHPFLNLLKGLIDYKYSFKEQDLEFSRELVSHRMVIANFFSGFPEEKKSRFFEIFPEGVLSLYYNIGIFALREERKIKKAINYLSSAVDYSDKIKGEKFGKLRAKIYRQYAKSLVESQSRGHDKIMHMFNSAEELDSSLRHNIQLDLITYRISKSQEDFSKFEELKTEGERLEKEIEDDQLKARLYRCLLTINGRLLVGAHTLASRLDEKIKERLANRRREKRSFYDGHKEKIEVLMSKSNLKDYEVKILEDYKGRLNRAIDATAPREKQQLEEINSKTGQYFENFNRYMELCISQNRENPRWLIKIKLMVVEQYKKGNRFFKKKLVLTYKKDCFQERSLLNEADRAKVVLCYLPLLEPRDGIKLIKDELEEGYYFSATSRENLEEKLKSLEKRETSRVEKDARNASLEPHPFFNCFRKKVKKKKRKNKDSSSKTPVRKKARG